MSQPTIKLSKSGLRVRNFSSPHPFNFEGGDVLPACEPDDVKKGGVEQLEELIPRPDGGTDVRLTFKVSPEFVEHVRTSEEDVDVLLVPFMVLQALQQNGHSIGRCRAIRCVNRMTKEVSQYNFCI